MGRHPIDSDARARVSVRAKNGLLGVVRRRCPRCHHHKALSSAPSGIVKCARCKRYLSEGVM